MKIMKYILLNLIQRRLSTTPSTPLDSNKFFIYDFINVYYENGSIINNLCIVAPKTFNIN